VAHTKAGPVADGRDGDTPLQTLKAAVRSQSGRAAQWHALDLLAHEQRYLADLRLVAGLASDGPIVEVGSAPCHMTALLHLNGYRVVGVDVAPQRVRDLIERIGLDVRCCDAEQSPLPFADGQFTGALLCETFEHLRIDPAFVLSEICRVLSVGGFLLLTTPNVYSLPSVARFALGKSVADPLMEFGKLRTLGHMGHVREYSAREVSRFIQAFGFAVESVDHRYHVNRRSRKGRLLGAAYHVVPRRFRREIVIVARKIGHVPPLEPLSHASPP
jgi:SAM-dependent methyltransferase